MICIQKYTEQVMTSGLAGSSCRYREPRTARESLDSLDTDSQSRILVQEDPVFSDQIQSLSAKFLNTNVCWGGVGRPLPKFTQGPAWMNFRAERMFRKY